MGLVCPRSEMDPSMDWTCRIVAPWFKASVAAYGAAMGRNRAEGLRVRLPHMLNFLLIFSRAYSPLHHPGLPDESMLAFSSIWYLPPPRLLALLRRCPRP